MPHQPQFVIHEQQTLGIAAETSMQMYPGANPTPATGFQQSHMGYPPTPQQPQYRPTPPQPQYQPTPPQPQYQPTPPQPQYRPTPPQPQYRPTPPQPQYQPTPPQPQYQPTPPQPQYQPTPPQPQYQPTPPQPQYQPTPPQPQYQPTPPQPQYQPAPATGYPPQQPTGYTMHCQGVDAVAIGTYSMPMGHNGAAPPTPPARPHPSTLPRYSVDYPPSVQPQQHRHSLQHQSTFPTFGVPMTNRTTYPTHARVPTLPVAQNYTSVTHVQQLTTLQQQQQPATPSSDPVVPQGYNIVVSPCTQICCCIYELFRTFLITLQFHITISCYSYEDVYLKLVIIYAHAGCFPGG